MVSHPHSVPSCSFAEHLHRASCRADQGHPCLFKASAPEAPKPPYSWALPLMPPL